MNVFNFLLPFLGVKGICYHVHKSLDIYKKQKDQTKSKDIIFIDTVVSNSNLSISRSEIVDRMNNTNKGFLSYGSIPNTFGISSSSSFVSM